MNAITQSIIPTFLNAARLGLIVLVFLYVPQHDACAEITLVGPQEDVLPIDAWGLRHTPDGHISFFVTGDTNHFWFTAGAEAHHFVSSGFNSLIPSATSNGFSVPILGPSGEGFDRNYAGPGSVIRAANGKDLLMFYHAEDWQWENQGGMPLGTYYGSIGLARSSDEGETWVRVGQVITGRDLKPSTPVRFANGAGVPSVVVDESGGFIYLYYTDWPTLQGSASGPDEIHVARAPISTDGVPGSWSKYFQGSFIEPGLLGNSEAVIRRANSEAGFAAFASVSFNSSLNSFIAVLLSDDGFYQATSADRINWTTPEKFFSFPVPHSKLETADIWYIYPTLLSPNHNDDMTTGSTNFLYYAQGIFNVEAHHMVRRRACILSSGSGADSDGDCVPSDPAAPKPITALPWLLLLLDDNQ